MFPKGSSTNKCGAHLICHLLFSNANAAFSAAVSFCFCGQFAHFDLMDDRFHTEDFKFSLRSQRPRSTSDQTCRQICARSHLMSAHCCPDALHVFHLTHSPLWQFCPPNPSGQSQLKEPHRFTQVPPFRHGLLLQKCLLAEHPRKERMRR